jgi:periplasmic protein CpxP/Spy
MRNNRKVIVGLIAAATFAVAGAGVYAQPEGSGPGAGYGPGAGRGAMGYGPGAGRGEMGPGMMGRGGREGHRGHGMWSNPAAAVEGHLAALKVELKITPDQDKAWQTFTAKARQQADAMIARRAQNSAQAPAAKLTAPEILAQRTARMKQGLASMESMTAAVTDLYGVLTPEQKAIADKQLVRGPMGGGGRHHRRG